VYGALSYECMRPEATRGTDGLKQIEVGDVLVEIDGVAVMPGATLDTSLVRP
jgi:hypothetical protein